MTMYRCLVLVSKSAILFVVGNALCFLSLITDLVPLKVETGRNQIVRVFQLKHFLKVGAQAQYKN